MSTSVDAARATDPATDHAEPRPTPWGKALAVSLAAAAIVTVVLLAFLWPSATSKAKDLPVGVVASQEAYDAFTKQAQAAADKQGTDLPYDFTRYDSRDDAVTAIRERHSYGAYVLPTDQNGRLEVLTAKAAYSSVATMLTSTGTAMVNGSTLQAFAKAQSAPAPTTPEQQQQAAQMQQQLLGQSAKALAGPKVTDVVPLSDDDSTGAGLALTGFPLTLGGIVGGMLLSNLVRGTWRRVLGVIVYAAIGGIAMVLVLDTWFGFAPAPTFELWAAIALSLAATVGLIVGLHSAIGPAGLGIGAMITMLIGNPISAAQAPKEFLTAPFGEIGQWFVPGASATLVKNLSYFPDADSTHAWLVLAGWVLLGLVLILVGHALTGGHGKRPARRTETAAA